MSNYLQPKQNAVVQKAAGAAVPQAIVIDAVLDIVKESIQCFTDYMKCREQEKTERLRIVEQLKAFNNAIEAQKEVYIDALEKNHDKVKRAYEMGNMVVKSALETGNMDMVKETYRFIIAISTNAGQEAEQYLNGYSSNNLGGLLR